MSGGKNRIENLSLQQYCQLFRYGSWLRKNILGMKPQIRRHNAIDTSTRSQSSRYESSLKGVTRKASQTPEQARTQVDGQKSSSPDFFMEREPEYRQGYHVRKNMGKLLVTEEAP